MNETVLYFDLRTGTVHATQPNMTGASLQEVTLNAPLPGQFLIRILNSLFGVDFGNPNNMLPTVIKVTMVEAA